MYSRVCFFARVASRDVLERVEFYAQDLQVLRELGYEVHIATRFSELIEADVYFAWWWTWAFEPLVFARWHRRPLVVTGTLDVHTYDSRPLYQRVLMATSLRGADANVFVSKMEYEGAPRKIRVRHPVYSPCSVDIDVYCPGISRGSDPIVLSIGWLTAANARRKGFYDLVRAAPLVRSAVPGVRFVFAGEHGSAVPELRELASQLGVVDCIDFVGAITRQEKVNLLQRCAVYAQPSWHEGFGVAILEALACGAAVVTCATGAVPEVVGDCAVLVAPGDAKDIARAIVELHRDHARARALGECGRARAVTTFPLSRRREELGQVMASVHPSGPAASVLRAS
ncbi:MAG: glycosyltransferase family 4 protein [Gemmatimonadales bacterium]|jgi:glycosyltransferase involved in cell wall biosynthesis